MGSFGEAMPHAAEERPDIPVEWSMRWLGWPAAEDTMMSAERRLRWMAA